MPVIKFYYWDKKNKKKITNKYDTDGATFICNVPEGRLLKKKKKFNFYIYNPRGETKRDQIREVPYPEAKELVKKWGTREQFCNYFTILEPDGSYKEGKYCLYIDQVHKIKLQRTASMLSMSVKDTVEYLIDKYDDMRHYNMTFVNHKAKHRPTPSDLSEFTE